MVMPRRGRLVQRVDRLARDYGLNASCPECGRRRNQGGGQCGEVPIVLLDADDAPPPPASQYCRICGKPTVITLSFVDPKRNGT